eukprot:snap_masked-scaffold_28-processed-gene-1.7-mRNA-1 protein AED:1.00 eAED:1.00 QI:0/0/0/0/1/1/2/0/139
MLNGILLGVVLYFTATAAIQEVENLTEHYVTNKKHPKELNKIYTFLLKLKAVRAVFTFHAFAIIIITLPNLIPSLNTTNLILLIDSIYLRSEVCFSFDPEKPGVFSSSRRTQNKAETSEGFEKEKQNAIEGKTEVAFTL